MTDWTALSDNSARPLASRDGTLGRGLLVFDIALPLLSPTLLLDHGGPEGTLSVLFDPAIGFGVMHRDRAGLVRHMLPGAEAAGTGSAQLQFRWDEGRWSLNLVMGGAQAKGACGTGARPLSHALLGAACRGGPGQRRDAALLWFGATSGRAPRAAPYIGPRTPLATPEGMVPAGSLRKGDLVLTADAGPCPIRAINHDTMPGQGSFAPVRLRAPFFGARVDLLVSGSQQILLTGDDVEYLFGTDRVLAEARALVDGSRAARAPRPAALPWLAFDIGAEALLLSGNCALATAPFGAQGPRASSELRRIDGYEARALLAMRRRGAIRSAA